MLRLPLKVYCPDAKKVKVRYVMKGFEDVGVPLVLSRKLTNMAIDSEVYPFDIVYRDKIYHVFFDITSATDKMHPEFMDGKNFYFKVHTKKEDLGKFPRFYPMAQSGGNKKLIKNLKEMRSDGKFLYDVHGVFSNSDGGLRMRTIALARKQDWKTFGWVSDFPNRHQVPKNIQGRKMNYFDHLRTQSRSRLCLALPGGIRKSYLTFRHVEIWGLGRCCLTTNPTNRFILGEPKNCWAEFKEDLSDFVDVVEYYLSHPQEREAIAQNGKQYFERYLTPKAHVEYIMDTILRGSEDV